MAEADIRRKTKVLEHAKQSGNVSHTCRKYGVSRDSFYRWKKQFENGGPEALRHARRLIEAWQKEYNEERPKKGLGGLTPAQHARQLARKSITVTARL